MEQREKAAVRAGKGLRPAAILGRDAKMSPAVTSTLRLWLLRTTRKTIPHNGLRRPRGPAQATETPGLAAIDPGSYR